MPRNDDVFDVADPPRPERDRGAWLTRQALRGLNVDPEEYRLILDVVRGGIDDVHDTISRWLDTNESDRMLQWSLLHVLMDLGDPRSLDLLHRQALRRVSERVREPGVCEQPADAEEMVVIMAIEGLGALARRGEARAVDALLGVVGQQDRRSLRRPAVAELLATDPTLREKIVDALPETDRHLAELRVAEEHEVTVPPPDQERSERPTQRETSRKPRWDRDQRRPLSSGMEGTGR